MKDIGGKFQKFKKGYEESYAKDTRDIDTIVNTLLYDEQNYVAKHWPRYKEFKNYYEKTFSFNTTTIKDMVEYELEDFTIEDCEMINDFKDDIRCIKSLATIIYDIGNWLGEDYLEEQSY